MIILLCFIILLGILLYLILKNKKNIFEKYQHSTKSSIPKIIWSYWNTNEKPEVIEKCIDSWRRSNPKWKINILSQENIRNYINIPGYIYTHPNMNDSNARFSDMIRLYLLKTYGGIWMDASTICNIPLETIIEQHPFVCYYLNEFTTNEKFPVIESWFIASIPNHPFISLWYDEFISIINYKKVGDYIQHLKDIGVDPQKIGGLEYLTIHMCAQKILQIDNYPTDNLVIIDAKNGPFKWVISSGWNVYDGFKNSCSNLENKQIMKLTSGDRKKFEEILQNDSELNEEKCDWFQNF